MKKRDLIGRRIVDVDWGRFATGYKEHPFSTDPVITLDNGAQLYFIVAETQIGEYGVEIRLVKPAKKKVSA